MATIFATAVVFLILGTIFVILDKKFNLDYVVLWAVMCYGLGIIFTAGGIDLSLMRTYVVGDISEKYVTVEINGSTSREMTYLVAVKMGETSNIECVYEVAPEDIEFFQTEKINCNKATFQSHYLRKISETSVYN